MRICYVDETGCTGTLPSPTSDIQPVFAPAGIILDQARLHDITMSFLSIKAKFFPNLATKHYLDAVLAEVKGADLRRQAVAPSKRQSRHALGFLDKYIDLLEQYDVRIIGRVLVKGIGVPVQGRQVYTSYMQRIFSYFQAFLESVGDSGILIADSRTKPQNANLSHSIFTQKFSTRGDRYNRIVEMPTYGHSDNHVGIQLADLLCSAFIFPLAVHSYCTGYINNVHMRPGYSALKLRYGVRLRRLQFLYTDGTGKRRGGIAVSDSLGKQASPLLFIGNGPVPREEPAPSLTRLPAGTAGGAARDLR
jgi:Protein of unknown function (DUF3800)